jgi:hypothetical protein
MWREVVAFIPIEKIVSVDYHWSETKNVIISYKIERYLKLKARRNSVLTTIFSLWHTSCALRDSLKPSPLAEHEQIKKERKEIEEKIFEQLNVLFQIVELPWLYPKIASIGVCYRSNLHVSLKF